MGQVNFQTARSIYLKINNSEPKKTEQRHLQHSFARWHALKHVHNISCNSVIQIELIPPASVLPFLMNMTYDQLVEEATHIRFYYQGKSKSTGTNVSMMTTAVI